MDESEDQSDQDYARRLLVDSSIDTVERRLRDARRSHQIGTGLSQRRFNQFRVRWVPTRFILRRWHADRCVMASGHDAAGSRPPVAAPRELHHRLGQQVGAASLRPRRGRSAFRAGYGSASRCLTTVRAGCPASIPRLISHAGHRPRRNEPPDDTGTASDHQPIGALRRLPTMEPGTSLTVRRAECPRQRTIIQ
jgi:hypothetical protein